MKTAAIIVAVATWFAEQLDAQNVSADHYRVIFKPSVIVPDIEGR